MVDEGSPLHRLVQELKEESPFRRGELLNQHEEMNNLHNSMASEGQTAVEEGKVSHHFICFIQHGESLWELDGTKAGPIDHGPLGSSSLLEVRPPSTTNRRQH